MRLLRLIASELLGLFVDDEFLAIAILALVALAGGLAFWASLPRGYVGILLVAGCLLIVAGSILRGIRR
jgi:hypothetical protein